MLGFKRSFKITKIQSKRLSISQMAGDQRIWISESHWGFLGNGLQCLGMLWVFTCHVHQDLSKNIYINSKS